MTTFDALNIFILGPIILLVFFKLAPVLSFMMAGFLFLKVITPLLDLIQHKDFRFTLGLLAVAVGWLGSLFLCRLLGEFARHSKTSLSHTIIRGCELAVVCAGPFYIGFDLYRSLKLSLLSEATYFGLPVLALLVALLLSMVACVRYLEAEQSHITTTAT